MTPEEARAIYSAGEDATVQALCGQHEEVVSLRGQVEALARHVAQLKKDSSTSHKPPSSDLTRAKSVPGDEAQTPRRRGGQPGHPKHERAPFTAEQVDECFHVGSASCPHCKSSELILLDGPARVVQQVELQEIVWRVEEHRAYPYYCCDCEEVHDAQLPAPVVRAGLFKEQLTALVAYLKHACHASFSTIRKFVRDIVGVNVSRGYLAKLIHKVSACLDRPYEELLARIPLEAKLHVDETGHKDHGERFWTWVFKADLSVLFRIDKSRGSQVLLEVMGKEFDGVLGCDYFSAYRKYMKEFNGTVQVCIAHLIRDIKYLTTLPDPETRAYGERLREAFRELFAIIHRREHSTPEAFRAALVQAKAQILEIALHAVPSERHAQNMAKRFQQHGEAYFEFITTPGVEPTNNLAEQAIRFVVIDRHITQGTRSAKGRRANERLWTVIATCSLQGRSAFEFILQALRATFYDEPTPSLLPQPP
jgi:transposase